MPTLDVCGNETWDAYERRNGISMNARASGRADDEFVIASLDDPPTIPETETPLFRYVSRLRDTYRTMLYELLNQLPPGSTTRMSYIDRINAAIMEH